MSNVSLPQDVYDELVSRALPRLVLTPSPDAMPLLPNEPAEAAVTEVRKRVRTRASAATAAPKEEPPHITVS